MDKNKTYYAVNLKAPYIYFWLLISFSISVFALWFSFVLFRDSEWLFALIPIPFTALFPFVLQHSLKSRIILTNDSVIKKTLFSTQELKYNEIKEFKRYK